MSEAAKNPFDPFFEEIRKIVHDEIASAIKRDSKLLYDTKEAARLCNVPAPWLAKAARANLIKCRRLGRYIRFSPEDLRDLIEKGGLTEGIPMVYKQNDQRETDDDGSGIEAGEK